jgi:hypothetical protein
MREKLMSVTNSTVGRLRSLELGLKPFGVYGLVVVGSLMTEREGVLACNDGRMEGVEVLLCDSKRGVEERKGKEHSPIPVPICPS